MLPWDLQSLFPSGHGEFTDAGSSTLHHCCVRDQASRGYAAVRPLPPATIHGLYRPSLQPDRTKDHVRCCSRPKALLQGQKPHSLDIVKSKTALGSTSPWGVSILHCQSGEGNSEEFLHLFALHYKGKSQMQDGPWVLPEDQSQGSRGMGSSLASASRQECREQQKRLVLVQPTAGKQGEGFCSCLLGLLGKPKVCEKEQNSLSVGTEHFL